MKVFELLEKLGLTQKEIVGDINKIIKGVSPLSQAAENQLTFCKKSNLLKTKGAIVIVSKTMPLSDLPKDNTYIKVDNPRLTFIRAMAILYPTVIKPCINSLAYIHPSAKVDS